MQKTTTLLFILFFLPLPHAAEALQVGAASTEITPPYFETYRDGNGNHSMDPGEPFEDTNKNGTFDAIWMAGFGRRRAAQGVHDSLEARALLLRDGKNEILFITLDLIGFPKSRTEAVQQKLSQLGFPQKNILLTSTHNHQGPDTLGIWGPQLDKSGVSPSYLDWLEQKIVEVADKARKKLLPAQVAFAKISLRTLSPYFNGEDFGGRNPKKNIIGLINDIRDPIIVDDTLALMLFQTLSQKPLAIVANWSGHAEVLGSSNTLLSADYVGYLRQDLEAQFGGTALFFPSDVGGMMSALGTPVPETDEKGNWIFDKQKTPQYITNGFSAAASLAFHLTAAAKQALAHPYFEKDPHLSIRSLATTLPVTNPLFIAAGKLGLIEKPPPENTLTPCASFCVPIRIYAISLGSSEILTVPGEILPELVISPPQDFLSSAPRPNRYFPQHNPASPLSQHLNPFLLSSPPLKTEMHGKVNFLFGLTDTEIGYILPPEDFNTKVKPLTPHGDHYEETNSLGKRACEKLLKKLHQLLRTLP